MLFKRKKDNEINHPVKEKVAKGIAQALLKIQSKFAAMMNTCTKNISLKKMKIVLVIFCLLGGGLSLYLIGEALLKPDPKKPALKIDAVIIPKYYDRNGDEPLRTDQFVDEETYHRIESFEKYMDSLQLTTSGQRTHDSILSARPRLIDSITMLKEIYNSQIK